MSRYIRAGFARNVITLMTGTGLAQLIPILLSPLLTRLYGPESFGTLAVFIGSMTVLVIALAGRYELAIVVPEKDKDAASLFILASGLALAISALMVIVSLLYFGITKKYFSISNISYELVFCLVPVSALLLAVNQCGYYWCNRCKDYKTIALNKIVHAIVVVSVQIGFGIYLDSGLGLIFGYVIGQIVSIGIFAIIIWRSRGPEFRQVRISDMARVAQRYVNFPKYLVFSHGIGAISAQAPAIFYSSIFGASAAGYYMLSQRAVGSPMTIVSGAIGDVFRQEASKEYSVLGSCQDVYIRTFVRLAVLSVIPFAILYIFAPDIFGIVFGAEWRSAGDYIRILVPMYLLRFIVSPLSCMYMIAESQKLDLRLTVILFILVMSSIVAGYYSQNVLTALIAFSGSYCLLYIVSGYYSYKLSKGASIEK